MKKKTYSTAWLDAWFHTDFIPNTTSFDEIIMLFLYALLELERMRTDGVKLLESTACKPFVTFYTTDPDNADRYQLNEEYIYEFDDETGEVIDAVYDGVGHYADDH